MRKLFNQGEPEEETNVDITPMLDVVFIMLIFFIVTATFVKESGIDVNRPPPSDQPPDEDKPNILVTIDGNDQIFVNRRAVDMRSVRPNIERLHAEAPEAAVVIQTHVDSTTDRLIGVMDASRQAGVYNVALTEQLR